MPSTHSGADCRQPALIKQLPNARALCASCFVTHEKQRVEPAVSCQFLTPVVPEHHESCCPGIGLGAAAGDNGDGGGRGSQGRATARVHGV